MMEIKRHNPMKGYHNALLKIMQPIVFLAALTLCGCATVSQSGITGSPPSDVGGKALETLPMDLMTVKTLYIPAAAPSQFAATLWIDGHMVTTPVGHRVAGFIANRKGYIALVRVDQGTQMMRRIERGTYQGRVLTPVLKDSRGPWGGMSSIWMFYQLNPQGRVVGRYGAATCNSFNRIGTQRSDMPTVEVTPNALSCHDDHTLVGVTSVGRVIQAPHGYQTIFAVKGGYIGIVQQKDYSPSHLCGNGWVRYDQYWLLRLRGSRLVRQRLLIRLTQSNGIEKTFGRIPAGLTAFVNIPDYSPSERTGLLDYQTIIPSSCSSNFSGGGPEIASGYVTRSAMRQLIKSGVDAQSTHWVIVVLPDAGPNADPYARFFGGGVLEDDSGVAHAFYATRGGSFGMSLLSTLFNQGNNSIAMDYFERSMKRQSSMRDLFTPEVPHPGMSALLIQTPGDGYVVPERTTDNQQRYSGYDVAHRDWIPAVIMSRWLVAYHLH